ncbi:hypothetical protein DLD77_02830 [Chitinophaga alhagiae]|uniref:DUF7674 domain-containing protein n=1 Tax=Chitinophaga alhagiae TaxID=2203219 RepID=A0ABM6W9S9_9BACT|nr:hypothetical protein [Chitinophaga alhagiae]AWO00704.1 hypothetical protein DLD77_02830 [Chitinophaga alhagiae]
MINQFEVPALIEDAIPQLGKALHQFPSIFHIYETMQCLRNFLLQQLRNKNYNLLEKGLRLAGRLYDRGNPLVRKAVADIILPGLSREKLPDNISQIKLYSLIPASFYNQFIQLHLNANHG